MIPTHYYFHPPKINLIASLIFKKSFGLEAIIIVSFIVMSCGTQKDKEEEKKEEQLAKQYCGSCHTFPNPGLLDKNTWEKGVLPQMAFRMGLNYNMLNFFSKADQVEILKILPNEPMLKNDEWTAIQNYYLKNAPDTLVSFSLNITDTIKQFDVKPFRLPVNTFPLTTLVETDTINNKIYVGNRYGRLYQFDQDFMLLDSFQLDSPPSHISFKKNGDPIVSIMGIMDPNDQPKGKLITLNLVDKNSINLIDSIKRPVHFAEVDINHDNLNDYLICAFGNYSGALLAYENVGDGTFKKHILQNLPGARRVIVKDFDKNGFIDVLALMSQGDEKILLFYNYGNFNFQPIQLIGFPPVYGSSYFDIIDFNKDGKFDILYTNGDNADYSIILKPYHGVRIFLNDGKNNFYESWFYPMHGASQAQAFDFDQDGDLDIAAISFFPDFNTHPEQSFIYFENKSEKLIPQITNLASSGRWITMNTADIDDDGDEDVLLGSLSFSAGVPTEFTSAWLKSKTSVLILKNKLNNSHAHKMNQRKK